MIVLVFIFLALVPFLVGQPVGKLLNYKENSLVRQYLYGVLALFVFSGAAQFVSLMRGGDFALYQMLYGGLIGLFSLAGLLMVLLRLWQEHAAGKSKFRLSDAVYALLEERETCVWMLLTLVVFMLCCVRILTGVVDTNGDFTFETVLTTLQTNSIYRYNSFTGMLIEDGMPIRQQILTLPFFLTLLSSFSDVEASTVVYRLFPCLVLFWSFLVYQQFGGTLFGKMRMKQSVFLFFVEFLILAGDMTELAPARLLLHQGFSGNALCVGVVIPFAILLCMESKWLPALWCVAAEMFLIWTTYGLGYCVLVILIFVLIAVSGQIAGRIYAARRNVPGRKE